MKVAIIIPAYNPGEELIRYVEELHKSGEKDIIVVDDGSKEEKKYIFKALADKQCVVISHAVNMGKGRALKNAFNYCMLNYDKESYCGVITVDSDGQHSVADVMRMKEALIQNRQSLILGVRNFSQSNVPPKSEFGNKITRRIIKLLHGGNISDTQTGLRAISLENLSKVVTLYGERFEYETGMLLEAIHKNIPIEEIEIETIYHEENKGTHFRAIVDSWKIYKLILGNFFLYTMSSLSSSLIDLGVFQIIWNVLNKTALRTQVIIATVVARIISSLWNYCVNKNIVFQEENKTGNSFIKYYILCVSQMLASAGGVYLLITLMEVPEIVIKGIVDILLFFISFRIQKAWVFSGK